MWDSIVWRILWYTCCVNRSTNQSHGLSHSSFRISRYSYQTQIFVAQGYAYTQLEWSAFMKTHKSNLYWCLNLLCLLWQLAQALIRQLLTQGQLVPAGMHEAPPTPTVLRGAPRGGGAPRYSAMPMHQHSGGGMRHPAPHHHHMSSDGGAEAHEDQ